MNSEDINEIKNTYNYLFRGAYEDINKISLEKDESILNFSEKAEKIFLQVLLSNNALTNKTKLLSTIFWDIETNDDDLKIDILNIPTSSTLLNAKEKDILGKYLQHYFLARIEHKEYSNVSVAKIIFNDFLSNVNWIFQKADDEFDCELIEKEHNYFIILKIPEYKNEISKIKLKLDLNESSLPRLNNFFYILLEKHIGENNLFKGIEDFDENIYDFESNIIQFEDLKKQISEKLNSKIFNRPELSHITQKQNQEIVKELSFKLPFYSFLSNLGTSIYITNTLFKQQSIGLGPVTSNGGIFLIEENSSIANLDFVRFSFIKDLLDAYTKQAIIPTLRRQIIDKEKRLQKSLLKTAIISILVDSYSHNISAHSLSALQWWFRKRTDESFGKKIFLDENPRIKDLNLQEISRDDLKKINQLQKDGNNTEYYQILGETDQNNSQSFSSLMDYVRFLPSINSNLKVQDLLAFSDVSGVYEKPHKQYEKPPHLPFPIDYAIWPFMKYLRDKGAFWSGVLGDNQATPGESINFFKLVWEDFINNPLYLGTIAHSEGINRINFYIQIDKAAEQTNKVKQPLLHWATIDLNLINDISSKNDNNNMKFIPKSMSYSDISFVRLGVDFKEIREKLSTEDYKIYLPGGIIGKHALFTIFENALRNIKHFTNHFTDKTKKADGVDFCISISPSVLFQEAICFDLYEQANNINNIFTEDEKIVIRQNNQLFRIGVWLMHSLPNEKDLFELFEKVSLNTIDSLLTQDGKPRMGGNAQDKVCAAALLLQRFTDAENLKNTNKKYLHQYYYPYSYWSIENGKDYLLVIYPPKFPENLEEFKIIYTKAIAKAKEDKESSKDNKEDKYLKKYFHVWRGADYANFEAVLYEKNIFDINDAKTGINKKTTFEELTRTQDNLARFKFILTNDTETINDLRDRGVIRIIGKDNSCIDLESYYLKWLNEWIPINNKSDENPKCPVIKIEVQNGSFFNINFEENDENKFEIKINQDKILNGNKTITIAHGGEGNGESNICDVRSHGRFLKDIIKNPNIKEIDNFISNYEILNLYELYETLATRILIIDNRIYNKLSSYGKSGETDVLRDLNLYVRNESIEEIKNFKDEIIKLICDENHIAIIHLSFITDALKYSEEDVYKLLDDIQKNMRDNTNSNKRQLPKNFILAITTGRGRDTWKNNNNIQKYKSNILHIPIESLESAIENAIVYKDDYQIKNNIIKVLFGS